MKLSTLLDLHIPSSNTDHQHDVMKTMRRVAKVLTAVLGRAPVATDLNRLTLEALGEAIRFYPVSNETKRKYIAAFRRMWRLAIDRKLVPKDYAAGARTGRAPIVSITDGIAAGDGKPLGPQANLWKVAVLYLSVPHYPHRKRPGRATKAKLKLLFEFLEEFLNRQPIAGDLSDYTYGRFLPWLEKRLPNHKANVRIITSLFVSMRRFAVAEQIVTDSILRTDTANKRHELLGEPDSGSLWDVCQRQYFPVNVRIRSPHTRHQYHIALKDFGEKLGHVPMPADLTDDNLSGLLNMLLERGLARQTCNERRQRIVALWNWMAKRRLVENFPAGYRLPVPQRIPQAWTAAQLEALFAACRQEPGKIAGVKACDWWLALHSCLWDTSERIGALLQVEWTALDWDTATLLIAAELRKGGLADMLYRLHPDTMAALRAIYREPGRIFRWEKNPQYIWQRYERILKRANLPTDRKSKFHRMRRSVASHLEAAGVNSSLVLGHSSPEITRKSYIDPRIAAPKPASAILFRPLPSPDVIDGSVARIEGPVST